MKSRDNFVAFLRVRLRNRRGPFGDLARELNQDPDAPTRGGPKTLRDYFARRGACDAVLLTLEHAVEAWNVNR
jgi:hypothetical protein